MRKQRTAGILFIFGAVAVLIPYTILIFNFDYPDILREDTASILIRFHNGGTSLIITWFAFAIVGLPLFPAYIFLGELLGKKNSWVKVATNFGLIGLTVQVIGLLRWVFIVPALARTFVITNDEATRSAVIVVFHAIHQFGGVLLGEHLGQLFTIIWTALICNAMIKEKVVPVWITVLGSLSAGIYLLAQGDLFATVIPDFPVWDLAGFAGSTLWLIWMVLLGVELNIQREHIKK